MNTLQPFSYIIGTTCFLIVVLIIYMFQKLRLPKAPVIKQPVVQMQNLYYDLCDICNQVIMSNAGFPTYDFL